MLTAALGDTPSMETLSPYLASIHQMKLFGGLSKSPHPLLFHSSHMPHIYQLP
jgi:hypothetical protein